MPKDITESLNSVDDLGRVYVSHYLRNISQDSPRDPVTKELILKQLPHTFRYRRASGTLYPVNGRAWPIRSVNGFNPIGVNDELLEASALAKWGRELKGYSASLGVTLGTWKESSAMIKARARNLGVRAIEAIAFYQTRKGWKKAQWLKMWRAREGKEPPANMVLENFFGWQPIIKDIHDAVEVVCEEVDPDFLTVRRSKRVLNITATGWGNPAANPWRREHTDGRVRISLAGKVVVSNPNTFFLNQLGLINPAVVVWDLIPFSWLVNAVSTTGTIVSSWSDEVGVDVTERSVTWSWDQTSTLFQYNRLAKDPNPSNRGGHSLSVNRDRGRNRTTGSFPAPSLRLKVPNLDATGTAIVVALLLQRMRTVQRLTRL